MLLWLVWVVHTMAPPSRVLAEPFYRRRDHMDQADYWQESNLNIVLDETDAELVLSKYGYLPCQESRRRREVGAEPGISPSHDFISRLETLSEGSHDVCNEQDVQTAIRTFQKTYNLPETGMLDEETRFLMSSSRCGNQDRNKLRPPAPSLPGTDVLITSSLDNQSSKQTSEVLTEDGQENTSFQVKKDARLWRRSVESRPSLYRLLSNTHKPVARSLEYHRKHFQDYLQLRGTTRSRQSRRLLHLLEPLRKKRSLQVTVSNSVPEEDVISQRAALFNKRVIRWRLLATGYSSRIPVQDQRATLDLAFRMWSEVIPLQFIEDTSGHINEVDIEIAFGKGAHQNCERDFDGLGGDIAHSWNAGNMHFDDEEDFKSITSLSQDGIYLLRVAVHEIGHVLGLSHTNKSYSIMYAYHGSTLTPEFELSSEDRQEVQTIYGVCKGSFDTVFDWVRRRPDNQFVYNTYFFRDNHYWMYENHANRTRYGDPLYIAREWEGVPDRVDGYAHVWFFAGTEIVDDVYFFKGDFYYKYNSQKDRVVEGWPRLISQDFGPGPGETEGVPSNLDSVFFDTRDKHLYFFKKDKVYVFDPTTANSHRGCCVRTRKIREEYPAAPGHRPLPDELDAVYYSYRDKTMYFLKGDHLWRNKAFDPRQRRVHNSIEYLGFWYQKWNDICDVVT